MEELNKANEELNKLTDKDVRIVDFFCLCIDQKW